MTRRLVGYDAGHVKEGGWLGDGARHVRLAAPREKTPLHARMAKDGLRVRALLVCCLPRTQQRGAHAKSYARAPGASLPLSTGTGRSAGWDGLGIHR